MALTMHESRHQEMIDDLTEARHQADASEAEVKALEERQAELREMVDRLGKQPQERGASK